MSDKALRYFEASERLIAAKARVAVLQERYYEALAEYERELRTAPLGPESL